MPDIRGIFVEAAGTYVVLEDVVASIREYAQSLDDANAGAAIHELASWLGASSMPAATAGITPVIEKPGDSIEAMGYAPQTRALAGTDADPFPLDRVYRVELYPHPPEDPRPKWYARSVDDEGNILWTTNGSYDYEYVHKEASDRWPGKPIHQLNRWADDSVFVENQERNAYPTAAPVRERVSPKRMFA